MPIQKWSDNVAVVMLADDPALSDELKEAEALVRQGPVDVVLDFSQVGYINSSNIAKLLRLRQAVVTADARLMLCGLTNQVWSAFLVTGLDKIFHFSDNVTLALATVQMKA